MKKTLIDTLREESFSEHVAYTEFITSYKKGSKSLYCFYEGKEDKRYYSIRIEQNTGRKSKAFTCNGKDNVFGLYELIKKNKEYDISSILFFIDKDFDFSGTKYSDIYSTPYYSIENFYASEETLSKILIHEFELEENNKDYKKIIRLFNSLQKKFHKETLLLNSWLACQYDKRKEDGINTYLRIDDAIDKYFKNIVQPDLKSLSDYSKLKDHNYIETILFPNAPKIENKILRSKIAFLRKIDGSKFFRGKFEIKFLISFLFRLQTEIGKKKSTIFSKRYSSNLRYEYCNSISTLSQYAETTKCLTNFLKNKLKKVA
jgi:hypothetical protein